MPREATRDEAAEFLRLTLPMMTKYAVPVTPVNYAVWFEYVSGVNGPLRQHIDSLIEHGETINETVTQDLHQKFVISKLERRLAKTREALRVMLDDMGDSMSGADTEMNRYQESLASYSDQLSGEVSTGELKNVIEQLSAETSAVRESGSALQDKLDASRKETEALRKELELVRHEATTDALTGLANRKALFRTLDQAIEASGNADTPVCLILGDIDNFKQVNDTYGHLLGDKVIRFIGSIMKECVRGKDLIARYGGEEFAVVLPETGYETALEVAEDIRQSIENGRLVRSDTREPIGTVTVSLGVAQWRSDETPDELIGRADGGLYQSKENGRNCVTGEQELIARAS